MIEAVVLLSLTVICAFLAVGEPNIVYGVIWLLCTNVLLGILYYLMGAPTVAIFQLAIFAGAVVVFFVLTIMLTRGGAMAESPEAEEVEG